MLDYPVLETQGLRDHQAFQYNLPKALRNSWGKKKCFLIKLLKWMYNTARNGASKAGVSPPTPSFPILPSSSQD